MHDRLRPPIWAHDAYPLRLLAARLDQIVGTFFTTPRQGTVIDLGCGDSPYRALFERNAYRYIPCDLPGGKGEVVLTPGEPVDLPSDSADGILSFQVLEHVWDIDWYLSEARRIVSIEGHIVVTTHGTWLYHPHPDDFRRWTRSGLIREIESRGFTPVQVQAIVGPLAWTGLFKSMAVSTLLKKIPLIGPVISGLTSLLWNAWLIVADAITPQQWIDTNAAIYIVVARRT